MAIKGKGKTKARQVARAPRRAPVEVPEPLFRRRWVQVTAGVLLGAFAVLTVIWVTNSLRTSTRESDEAAAAERRRDALSSIQTDIETPLGTVGQLQDPLPPIVAPQVREAAEALAKGKGAPVETEALEQLAEDLGAAATALEGIDLDGAIREADEAFDVGQVEALIAARAQLVGALRDLEQGATVVVVGLQADDPTVAEEMASTATALADSADALLANAWRAYRNELAAAGLAGSTGGVELGS